MWELDHKEGWVWKKCGFRIAVLEKTFESHWGCKIKAVNPKWNQSWIFIGRTDAEAEAPILWPPDEKRPVGKDPDAGKVWRQEVKGTTEDEMVGWHCQLNGHQFEQALGYGEGQGSLGCCSLRDRRVGHDWVTEQHLDLSTPPFYLPTPLRGMTWVLLQAELYCLQLAPNLLLVVSQEIFVEQINEISPPTYVTAFQFLISSYEWTMDCKLL